MGTSGAERSRWLSEVSRVSHGDAWGRAWAGPSAAVGRRGRALSCAQTCSGTSYEYTSNGLPAQSKRPLRLAGSARTQRTHAHALVRAGKCVRASERSLHPTTCTRSMRRRSPETVASRLATNCKARRGDAIEQTRKVQHSALHSPTRPGARVPAGMARGDGARRDRLGSHARNRTWLPVAADDTATQNGGRWLRSLLDGGSTPARSRGPTRRSASSRVAAKTQSSRSGRQSMGPPAPAPVQGKGNAARSAIGHLGGQGHGNVWSQQGTLYST